MSKIIDILKKLFHRHALISFKYCDRYLVNAYCPKCGIIKQGNPHYYDGSFYQHTFSPEYGIEMLNNAIKLVKNTHKHHERLAEEIQNNKKSFNDLLVISQTFFNNYESIEQYQKIIKIIEKHI